MPVTRGYRASAVRKQRQDSFLPAASISAVRKNAIFSSSSVASFPAYRKPPNLSSRRARGGGGDEAREGSNVHVRPRSPRPPPSFISAYPPIPSTFSRSLAQRQNHESRFGATEPRSKSAGVLTGISARESDETVPERVRNTDNNKPEKCSQRAAAPEPTPSLSETGALRVGEGGNSRR